MQRLLGNKLYYKVSDAVSGRVCEVRLRLNRKAFVSAGSGFCQADYTVTAEDIERILCVATDNSVYALSERINNGYINYAGGIRIGVAGEAVMDKERIQSLKHISSLVVRAPFEAKGCSEFLPLEKLFGHNLLIISPPYGGKTTLLRDIARRLADNGKNIVVIDERFELSAKGALDLGECSDIIGGMPKSLAYCAAVRSLNPAYIVTDELMGGEDIASVADIKRSGVGVIATIHAQSVAALKKSKESKAVLEVFDMFVTLSALPRAGTVVEVLYA